MYQTISLSSYFEFLKIKEKEGIDTELINRVITENSKRALSIISPVANE